jgi:hypothetical protein
MKIEKGEIVSITMSTDELLDLASRALDVARYDHYAVLHFNDDQAIPAVVITKERDRR